MMPFGNMQSMRKLEMGRGNRSGRTVEKALHEVRTPLDSASTSKGIS